MINLTGLGQGTDCQFTNEFPWERNPHRLWSLWEMLEVSALEYIELGRAIENAEYTFELNEDPSGNLADWQKEEIRKAIRKILEECSKLALPTSRVLVSSRIDDVPRTEREFRLLIDAVKSEIKSKLFLFIPPHRAKYYNLTLPSIVTIAFPSASAEMVSAGNSFAAALYTACVFHAMRAAEIGVRVLATNLEITFSFPVEFAEWGKIVAQIGSKIEEIEKRPRGPEREADLAFYSEAATQFRYFNAGWRVRESHARATFDEAQALTVLDHTLALFQTLAMRLKE